MNPIFWSVLRSLFEGFGVTLKLFALTLIFALPLGLLICFGSMSKLGFTIRLRGARKRVYPLSALVKTFVWIIRGTPLMLQLIVIYYGPGLMFDWDLLPRFTAVLLAFVINYACYFSEIYRGGIESISRGQYEAGQVLGMSKSQIFFKVVLLQVIKRIVPPMSNEIITLVKDTALARVIAVVDIIKSAEELMSQALIWPLFYTGVFYLIFVGLLTILLGRLEKKLDYFKA